MDDSTSDCQLNQGEVDFEFESNEVPKPLCVVDDQFVPKVGMTFTTLEDAGKFYKDYAKATVVLHHSHPCCPSKAEMLKQHRELSMSVRRTIENNEEAGIRPSKTYQSFVAAAGGHRELNFIEKDVRNYITREVRNVSEQEDAKEFRKYLLRMKEKNQNFFFELELEDDQLIKLAFWADARSRAAFEYFRDVISFDTTYNTNRYNLVCGSFVCRHESPRRKCSERDSHRSMCINEKGYRGLSLRRPSYMGSNLSGSPLLGRDEKHTKEREEQAERESDATDFHTIIPCATKSSIEAQFQHVYTHQKFREVQAQFRGKANCITRLTNSALGYSVYEVGEQVCNSIFNKFVVTYDSVAAEKVKRRHTHIKSSHGEPLLEPRSKRFDELVFRSQNICEFESELEELTAILHRAYDEVMVEMEELKAKRKGTCSLSHEDANLEFVNELQSPPRVRTRGCPKNRLGSKLDKQIANALKKKKTKALNELNLFDAASVVHPNSSQYQGCVMNYQFREPTAGDSFLGV
ncbi:Protein FAR1-RELATED SEQUENCE [Arachis hypogaea]|uniref:Protein FAR1-RELATED SEQUENCE n=1 Tax=Arachis hypogaea TaxID=3818 RepID=A0A6B9VDX5_ARAHY|nr:Protein FAR1-RELATED SEQUENCE [Arachis hypogaea]